MKKFYTTFFFLIMLAAVNAQTTDVVTGLDNPQGIVLFGDDLYVAEPTGGKISKIDLTSSTPTAIDVVTGLNTPRQLAIHGNDLYISESAGNKISKIDLTSSTPTPIDVITTGLDFVQGLFVDGDELYFTETIAGKISKINLTETTPTVIEVTPATENPISIAILGDNLFVAEYTANRISRLDISGPTPVFAGLVFVTRPNALKLVGNNLFISQEGTGTGTASGNILVLDATEDTLTTSVVLSGLDFPAGLEINNGTLYISELILNKVIEFDVSTLSINQNELNNKVIVYPNPTSNFIELSGLVGNKNYIIHNTLGALIAQGTLSNNKKIDVQHLTNGVYFLKLDKNTYKFIKE